MPKVFEIFGVPVDDHSPEAELQRKSTICPFMNAECDGGGNRYLSHIRIKDGSELASYFPGRAIVPSGVCSIQPKVGERPWIVCPRRLLSFGKNALSSDFSASETQQPIIDNLFSLSGYLPGDRIGVWSEVKLKYLEKNTGKSFDYTFDYVVFKLGRIYAEDLELKLDAKWKALLPVLQQNGFTLGSIDGREFVEDFPLLPPIVVEIMTSSTSGGNKSKRTTIPNAFEDAILGKEHNGPGINYRQVWARMVSQLIVKSEVGKQWGGFTFWILQDALIDYISSTTALDVREFLSTLPSEVNILGLSYGDAYKEPNGVIGLDEGTLYSGPIRTGDSSEKTFQDMIRAPIVPPVEKLISVVLKKKPSAVFEI